MWRQSRGEVFHKQFLLPKLSVWRQHLKVEKEGRNVWSAFATIKKRAHNATVVNREILVKDFAAARQNRPNWSMELSLLSIDASRK
ncbi:hypothetical protein NPIL_65921 [Nephila pilipes]|uniref:Uncharacterized protein n=1 Tax=Nephila pilipes TaxID=299642 RepID=A0A8X6QTE1_NEPPI|nr:hypothetical protein NPIL_65921 [Nephila pilipes]